MGELFEAFSDLDDMAERLAAADAGERRVAVMELGNSGDPDAVPLLAGMLDDPDVGVRQQTAQALGEYDGPEAAAALAIALCDPEPEVAQAAADSMAELKEPASADPLLPLVGHASAFVRMSSLRAFIRAMRRMARPCPGSKRVRSRVR